MEFGKIVKTFKSKKGNNVVIRYLKKEDFEDLLKFANDLSKEDTFVLLSGEVVSREEEIKYVTKSLEKMEREEKIQLVVFVNGKFAGNSEIHRYKRRQRHAGNISISVAAPYREEGIGTEFLKALITEGKKLGLRLLTIECFEINDRALHIYEKLGFRRIGKIPGMNAYKGEYIDEVLLCLPLVEK